MLLIYPVKKFLLMLFRISDRLARKGGVGKSTIATNLAFELARMGGRVGLLDVDVHGPSLPVLVKPDDSAVRRSPLGKGMVYPINHQGVRMMSLGYVSSEVREFVLVDSFARISLLSNTVLVLPEWRPRKWARRWSNNPKRSNVGKGGYSAVSEKFDTHWKGLQISSHFIA